MSAMPNLHKVQDIMEQYIGGPYVYQATVLVPTGTFVASHYPGYRFHGYPRNKSTFGLDLVVVACVGDRLVVYDAEYAAEHRKEHHLELAEKLHQETNIPIWVYIQVFFGRPWYRRVKRLFRELE